MIISSTNRYLISKYYVPDNLLDTERVVEI